MSNEKLFYLYEVAFVLFNMQNFVLYNNDNKIQ